MTTPASNYRPVCPLDLHVGATYIDYADMATFTVAEITVHTVQATIRTTAGNVFTIGGLYSRLYRVLDPATEIPAAVESFFADVDPDVIDDNISDPDLAADLAGFIAEQYLPGVALTDDLAADLARLVAAHLAHWLGNQDRLFPVAPIPCAEHDDVAGIRCKSPATTTDADGFNVCAEHAGPGRDAWLDLSDYVNGSAR